MKDTEGKYRQTGNVIRSVKEMEAERAIIDEHNPIKLYEGPLIDTTDKTHIKTAEMYNFDPMGMFDLLGPS